MKEEAMQRQTPLALALVLLGSMAVVPAARAALPTCTQFATNAAYGLFGNPSTVPGTLNAAIIPAAAALPPAPPGRPTATPATPAYCQVNFTYTTGLSGPADGYDVGQVQMIKIRISLPLSLADGGNSRRHGANGSLHRSSRAPG